MRRSDAFIRRSDACTQQFVACMPEIDACMREIDACAQQFVACTRGIDACMRRSVHRPRERNSFATSTRPGRAIPTAWFAGGDGNYDVTEGDDSDRAGRAQPRGASLTAHDPAARRGFGRDIANRMIRTEERER
jgi:hypothetical protein